jgi:GTP-binding protein EngB required for normal cell division
MFRQQKIILESVPALRDVLSRYTWQGEPAHWLALAEDSARQFIVTLPLVGAFSSGKSSILNALLGEPLFSVNIDPETAVPAEVTYGVSESLTGCLPDGRRIPLDREAVRENRLDALHHGGWVEAVLPIPRLAHFSHLRLVDMPGWDSGIEAHSAAIDNYVARSLAYAIVVSAEEGNLRESLRKALKELAVHQMPVLAIISKADKKLPEEVAAVVAQVEREIAGSMGRPPFKAIQVSARKKDVGELLAALAELESQAEPLFAQNTAAPFAQRLHSLHRHLDTLLNSDDLDSEKIKAECERQQAEMHAFESRLNEETTQLDARVQPVLGRILQQLEARLRSQLDSLVSQAINGSDLQGSIGSTVRLAVEEGMRDEFNPEIERYLHRVAEGLPSHFSPEVSFNLSLNSPLNSSENGPLIATPLAKLILPALPSLGPYAPIILGVVFLLEQLFRNKSQQKVEEARQRENVRQKMLNEIIPSTAAQVKNILQPQLHQHIQQAKQNIADSVRAQQASQQAALDELHSQLEKGQAAFALACTQYRSDQAFLQTLITQLTQLESA